MLSLTRTSGDVALYATYSKPEGMVASSTGRLPW
jgi:hypothetical protein